MTTTPTHDVSTYTVDIDAHRRQMKHMDIIHHEQMRDYWLSLDRLDLALESSKQLAALRSR